MKTPEKEPQAEEVLPIFMVGDTVRFPLKGKTQEGIVNELKESSLSVTDPDQPWNSWDVPLSLVTRVSLKDPSPGVSRFDLSEPIWELLNLAIQEDLLDAAEVFVLGTEFMEERLPSSQAGSWVCDKIVEIAWAQRHTNPEGRSRVLRSAEKFWATPSTSQEEES